MISDLDESLGSQYFLKVANERKCCFASCVYAFKSSGYSFLEVKHAEDREITGGPSSRREEFLFL